MEEKKAFQHLTLKCLLFAPPLGGIDKNVIYSDGLLQIDLYYSCLDFFYIVGNSMLYNKCWNERFHTSLHNWATSRRRVA
jgi:hypothetical protein